MPTDSLSELSIQKMKLLAHNLPFLPFGYGALDEVMQVLSKGKKKRFSRAWCKNFKKVHTYRLFRTGSATRSCRARTKSLSELSIHEMKLLAHNILFLPFGYGALGGAPDGAMLALSKGKNKPLQESVLQET